MKWMTAFAMLFATACGERDNLDTDAGGGQLARASASAPANVPTIPARSDSVPSVVFFGTSLTAGYGLNASVAYPAVVERLAAEDGVPIRSVNAGLSGETSAGALRRIEWALREPADVVVIETGANDGLRALDVTATRTNIEQLVRQVQRLQPNSRVLLVQMEAPRNFGADYTERFSAMYREVAASTGATLIPFLLEGVATVPSMNQADGIHPNAAGAERVAANVWRALKPVIEELPAPDPGG